MLTLRLGSTSESVDEAAIAAKNKKIKFLNFILNLHQKHAFRAWREKVFGTGGDPRLGLLLMSERDRVREEFFKPQIERRKNLRVLRKVIADKNHRVADEVRSSLISLRKVMSF